MTDVASNIEEARTVLAGLMGDLATAVFVFRRFEYDSEIDITDELKLGIYRLTFTSIFVSCSKYTEFCRKYGAIVNSHAPGVVKAMNHHKCLIESKGINGIRNDFIGHIHSKELGRPLTNAELSQRFESVLGGKNIDPFLDWIMPTKNRSDIEKDSLVGVIGEISDALRANL